MYNLIKKMSKLRFGLIEKEIYEEIVQNYELQLQAKESFIKSLKEDVGKLKALKLKHQYLNKENQNLKKELNNKSEIINKLNERIDQMRIIYETKLRDQADSHNECIETLACNAIGIINFMQLLSLEKEKTLQDCLDLTKKKMCELLEEMGVVEKSETPECFDPSWQRAVDYIHAENEKQSDSVASVVRSAYFIKGKCIVPQDVIVYSTNI